MKNFRFSDNPQIKPYIFKGLKGRYGHWPAQDSDSKRTFVVVYGQHAVIERILPIINTLQSFGDVYLADNPGFGGMESPFKIKHYPNLAFYAEHLKHFIDEYIPKSRQITFIGISYGFQMISEFNERYPEYNSRIESTISFVGFVSPRDFEASFMMRTFMMNILPNIGRTRLGAAFYNIIIRESFIRSIYYLTKNMQTQFKSLSGKEAKRYIQEQSLLWIANDNRTHAATAWDFVYNNDLTGYRIKLDLIHICTPQDHFFNNRRVVEDLKQMFKSVQVMELNLANHAPLELDTASKVRAMLPNKLIQLLKNSTNKEAVSK